MLIRPDYLTRGEAARLIPIVPDSAREQKSASVLLAGLRSVLELRQALLRSVGIRVGKTSQLEAWTEIVFTNHDKKAPPPKDRPDGLLILRTGKREWKALIEAKVGNETIKEEQVSRYLQQAKAHNIDAVITITNQFAALPTHHPVRIPKSATKSVDLYHWSWAFIRTQCQLLLKNEGVEDDDQVFILSELLRYFESDRAGISNFDQMNAEWKDVVNKIKSNTPLSRTSDEVQNTVSAWHQEQRDLCLIMTRLTGSEVTLKLKNQHRLDAAKRVKDDADDFCKNQVLTCALSVPNAAAELEVTADVQRRMIHCSMKLAAPKDKKSTKARVNWVVRQLKKANPHNISIKAIRPGGALPTQELLMDLRQNAELLESDTSRSTASTFEIVYSVDLAAKFGGRKVFIEELEKAVPHFYQEAGQWLRAWTPPAPRIEPEREPASEQQVDTAEDFQL